MLAYIKGTLEEMQDDAVIIDHQGLGFRVFTSSIDLANMPPIGQMVKRRQSVLFLRLVGIFGLDLNGGVGGFLFLFLFIAQDDENDDGGGNGDAAKTAEDDGENGDNDPGTGFGIRHG